MTFIRYTQGQKIGKPNNLKYVGATEPKSLDRIAKKKKKKKKKNKKKKKKNRQRSPMHEERRTLVFTITALFSHCKFQYHKHIRAEILLLWLFTK